MNVALAVTPIVITACNVGSRMATFSVGYWRTIVVASFRIIRHPTIVCLFRLLKTTTYYISVM